MQQLSSKAQGMYDALKARQDTDRPFFLSGPTTGKSDAAAAWRELVAAGLVTESVVAPGVAKYEIATDGTHGESSNN